MTDTTHELAPPRPLPPVHLGIDLLIDRGVIADLTDRPSVHALADFAERLHYGERDAAVSSLVSSAIEYAAAGDDQGIIAAIKAAALLVDRVAVARANAQVDR